MSEQLKHLRRVDTLMAADNIAVTAIKYTFDGDLADSPNQDAAARAHALFPAYLQAAAQQIAAEDIASALAVKEDSIADKA
ncbi:MAG: hypothetical protein ABJ263_03430 [Tateyamaria sp.]|uniref:hypothetical protein n=1 Tax=Tateyamaria sp. TaxID=1929288 RepID=UPI00328041AE